MSKRLQISARDVFCLVVGILFGALGTALFVRCGLGITVMSSMGYVISGKLTFFTYGVWNYIMQGVVMLVMIGILRSVKVAYLFSFGVSVISGYTIDLFGILLKGIAVDALLTQLLLLALAIPVMGCGIGALLMTRLPIAPFDIIVREIVEQKQKSARVVKTTVDLCCLTVSCFLSLLFYGNLAKVGIVTLLLGLFNGTNVAFWKKLWTKGLERVPCFREK